MKRQQLPIGGTSPQLESSLFSLLISFSKNSLISFLFSSFILKIFILQYFLLPLKLLKILFLKK